MDGRMNMEATYMSAVSRMHRVLPANRNISQNIEHHLWDRENCYNRKNLRGALFSTRLDYEREFYKSIPPNFTILNVDKPLGYMRKFTPDGHHLLSFSVDQRSLEIYKFCGVGNAADLLQNQRGECISADDRSSLDSLHIRQQIFQRLFKLKYSIRLAPDMLLLMRCHLNREFSIFFGDGGRYVLVTAMSKFSGLHVPVDYIVQYPDLYDECELFDYTFFMIDIHKGIVLDIMSYRNDCIMLSHNHGVSVYGNKIAILSKCRQCIELVEFVGEKLVHLYRVGPQYFNPEEEIEVPTTLTGSSYFILSHIKQRILAHLYRLIIQMEDAEPRKRKLHEFYKEFRIYESMVMTKMQLIDGDHLLIRYEENPSRMQSSFMDSPSFSIEKMSFKLYVFYCISQQEVIKVYTKNSVDLLLMLRCFCDNFRNVRSTQINRRPPSSPGNNIHFRAAFNNTIRSVLGGYVEAALRFNPTLPISTQSFTPTPYLDYSLFNYDESLISALERPKVSSTAPIRFCDRNTNMTKFRIFLETNAIKNLTVAGEYDPTEVSPNIGPRELVAFIFHPYEPFAISIQKLTARYVLNFHIYNPATIVKK